jgi:hypothetical protein
MPLAADIPPWYNMTRQRLENADVASNRWRRHTERDYPAGVDRKYGIVALSGAGV